MIAFGCVTGGGDYVRVPASCRKKENTGNVVTGLKQELIRSESYGRQPGKRLMQAHDEVTGRNGAA